MGQYYKGLILDKEKIIISDGRNYKCDGYKLLELSYLWKCKSLDSVSAYIKDHPCRIAWIGDYSNSYTALLRVRKDEYMKYYNLIWANEEKTGFIDLVTSTTLEESKALYKDAYLINIDQKIYIDFNKFIRQNIYSSGDCFHPLSLLTACGNGQGNGDYPSSYSSDIGDWAFDTIYLSKTKPEGFTEKEYLLKFDFHEAFSFW